MWSSVRVVPSHVRVGASFVRVVGSRGRVAKCGRRVPKNQVDCQVCLGRVVARLGALGGSPRFLRVWSRRRRSCRVRLHFCEGRQTSCNVRLTIWCVTLPMRQRTRRFCRVWLDTWNVRLRSWNVRLFCWRRGAGTRGPAGHRSPRCDGARAVDPHRRRVYLMVRQLSRTRPARSILFEQGETAMNIGIRRSCSRCPRLGRLPWHKCRFRIRPLSVAGHRRRRSACSTAVGARSMTIGVR